LLVPTLPAKPTPPTPPPASPASRGEPRSVLTPWQRPIVAILSVGTVLVSATGLYLATSAGGSTATEGAFLVHLVVGALLVPILLAFTVPHAIAQTRRKPFIALSGAGVLVAALAATATGVSLIVEPTGARGSTLPWHWITGFVVLGLYVLHRRFGTNPARYVVLGGALAAVAVLAVGMKAWESADPGPVSIFETGSAEAVEAARVHFFPSSIATGAGGLTLSAEDLRDISTCGTCHRQITQEWKRSAHRHASMTNPVYRSTIADMRERFPKEDARWCAGCHDPALLFRKDPKSGISPIASPELDFESEDARTGLTCVVCHSMEPRSTLGNSDGVLRARKVYAGETSGSELVRKAHDVLLRLKPRAHFDSMHPKNVQESGYCSLCHKAEPPPELTRWHWARAQDEYDAHDDSGVSMGSVRSFYHPKETKRCQDCHMPLVADQDDPAADDKGMVRSHLFAAANTALPHLRGDTDMIEKTKKFLTTACYVHITQVVLPGDRRFLPAWAAKPAVKPGEVVEADVVVRNFGVGHGFPGGTVDSNEVWLDFSASVGDEPAFYASGRVDPKTHLVDRSAEFYRAYWIRRDGSRFVSRIASDLYTQIYVKRIGPGSADIVRYRFRVPEGASGALKLTATLRYRKFDPEILASVYKFLGTGRGHEIKHHLEKEGDIFHLGEFIKPDLDLLPIADMATGTLELPITAEGTPGPAPDPATLKLKLPDDRERINDLGIAYFVQTEFEDARKIFRLVTRVDPKYADGYINVARAALGLTDLDDANAALDGAFAAISKMPADAPALPKRVATAKASFFRAMTKRVAPGGDFAGAEALFKSVLETFPRERETYRRLADVLYQQDKYREALDVLDRFMKIEPEDWEAWYWAMRCYEALGDKERAAAAQAAHDRFRLDADLTHRRGPYTITDPNLHMLSQPVHVHVADDLK
jgi:hypothetical protein